MKSGRYIIHSFLLHSSFLMSLLVFLPNFTQFSFQIQIINPNWFSNIFSLNQTNFKYQSSLLYLTFSLTKFVKYTSVDFCFSCFLLIHIILRLLCLFPRVCHRFTSIFILFHRVNMNPNNNRKIHDFDDEDCAKKKLQMHD